MILALACGAETPDLDVSPTAVSTPGDARGLIPAGVLQVFDGATIEVEIDGRAHRVRYLGVDIPKSGAPADGERSIGERALEFNRFLVEGKTVQLEKGSVDADPSGNLLRYVYVGGEMVNEALLTNGYATVAEFPAAFRRRADFLAAEENAKASLRGVWEAKASADGQPHSTPTSIAPFRGGTLPVAPSGGGGSQVCEFSGTSEPVIKGNIDARTGESFYHVPDGLFYSTTVIDEARGDRWFCTEAEAVGAGFKRSKR